MTICMGIRVRDRVSGFIGIVTAKTEYINGCIQYLVRPPVDKDGKYVDGHWIDVQVLEVIDDGIASATANPLIGGERSDAPPTSYDSR